MLSRVSTSFRAHYFVGAGLLAVICLLMIQAGSAAAAGWSKPQRIATQPPLEEPASLTGVSCPSDDFCAAADNFGNVVTSTNPTGGAANWTLTTAKETDSGNGFSGVSCASSSFCAAVDIAGGVSSSTDPTGGSGAWQLDFVPDSSALEGISCPSPSLCLAASGGDLAVSTDPVAGSWTTVQLSATEGVTAVTCTSVSFCAAVSSGGKIWTTSDAAGGAAAWTSTSISSSELDYVSCASSSLCVAGRDLGTLYASTDPTGGAGAWTDASVGLRTVSCPTTSLCVGARNDEVVTSTNPTGGAGEWTAAAVGQIRAVSCTASTHCVAVGEGNVITSTNPTGGAAAWSTATVDVAGSSLIQDLSCPSSGFCAAVDRMRHVMISTNPINDPATWTSFHLEGVDWSPGLFSALSCPSTGLCVATSGAEIATSSSPAGGVGSWSAAVVDPANTLNDVACPSTSLCVVVDASGNVLSSANPTGGAGAWTSAALSGSPRLRAVGCASTSLCLAVDEDGNVWHSTNPAGGAGAWSSVPVAPGTVFSDVSCTAGLCTAVASYPTFNLAATSDPTGNVRAWTVYRMDVIGARKISCPSANLCLAGGFYNGNDGYLAASADPLGGASTWLASGPDDPTFVGDRYTSAVSCISTTLCVIGDKLGRVTYGAPATNGEERHEEGSEEEPTNPEEESTDQGSTCSGSCSASGSSGSSGSSESSPSGPGPAAQPGEPSSPRSSKAVLAATAVVVGGTARLAAHCAGGSACAGIAKLKVRIGRATASTAKAKSLTIGRSHFHIPAGKTKTIKIHLTKHGTKLVKRAGKKGLRARLIGTGLKTRVIKLKASQHKAHRHRATR